MPSKKRKRYGLFSVGQLNRLIDDLIHPRYRQNESLRLLDGFLHGLVEQNLSESVKKFVRYNLAEVLRRIAKECVKGDAK